MGYADPWNIVRSSYTGIMAAFHLVLAVASFGPYSLRALLADAHLGEHGVPRLLVALGWASEYRWFWVPTGVVLVAYNAWRIAATWWLSQLRDQEVRTGYAPRRTQYWWWKWHRVMGWISYGAIMMAVARTGLWLFEWV